MKLEPRREQFYRSLLYAELQPALGCTEPIAIAYAAAVAADAVGGFPEKITVSCSGNIIKNVKSVIVPNTGGLRGVETAAVAGFLAARPQAGLQVLETLTDDDRARLRETLDRRICEVKWIETPHCLHVIIEAEGGGHGVLVELLDSHTHISRLIVDGVARIGETHDAADGEGGADDGMSLAEIYTFCLSTDVRAVHDLLARQVAHNRLIAEEGLSGRYGVGVGRALLEEGSGVAIRARAYTAAGSDARMGGCGLPVIINSGSGNQGLTVSVPVAVYAGELGADEETLDRALLLSNLIAIFLKRDIGKLSAYCGAVTAACGAGAAITYLHGGDFDAVCRTVTNTLANVSGIICDGAKPSCAAKIATSVEAALLAERLSMEGRCFAAGDGIIGNTADETVRNIGRLAREGMSGTDAEILKIMTERLPKEV